MKLLKNAGTHKILSIMNGLHGENPLQLIESAGRVAYQSQSKITPSSAETFVQKLIIMKHESVLEHSCMTVQFDNCSRGFTHELVRHRLMSVTQESTRYVDESDFDVVVPPNQNADTEYLCPDIGCTNFSYQSWMKLNEDAYRSLRRQGWTAQDARQILPIGIVSQIVCTANFREWRHIFDLRTSRYAHWEIRRVMIQLLADVQLLIPVVFDDIKPEFTLEEARQWEWDIHGSIVERFL